MLRIDDYCNGPYDCPYANTVICSDCGLEEQSSDTNILECSKCESRVTVQNCSECPTKLVNEVRAKSEAGRILESVLEVDYAMKNYKVDWDHVSADTALYIRILNDERDKYQREKDQERRAN